MTSAQVQKVIERLGFTQKEAQIYIAALSLGECHVSDIAMAVKLPRTSVQLTVTKLQNAGLMNFYTICHRKYWVAENPERLLNNLQNREMEIREALPKLEALKNARRKTKFSQDYSASLGFFHALADTSIQAVLITNSEIEIEYVNQSWERLFGYTLDEVRGKNPRILHSGKTSPEVHKDMWNALNSDKLFQSDQMIDMRKDGTFFTILTTIFPAKHNGNLFFIQILDDVSENEKVMPLILKFKESEKCKR